VTDDADSPHRDVLKAQGELYCGFGGEDPYTPAPTVAAVKAALSQERVGYSFEVHAGADHGYALPDRDVYNRPADDKDWKLILAMFGRQLTAI
jgi:carboxymethylenebutenolidase